MIPFAPEELISQIEYIEQAYYRLILVVAPSGSGKTAFLKKIQYQLNIPYLNINLELSRKLINLSHQEKKLQTRMILEDILDTFSDQIAILDNIEMLFASELALDPLQLLKTLSRNRTLVVAWSGYIKDNYLIYAEPNHPEYRKEPIDDIYIVSFENA